MRNLKRSKKCEMEGKKRIRNSNMTWEEKHLLADLCVKYKDLINARQVGSTVSNKAKDDAWKELTSQFNTTADVNRSSTQLKHVRYTWQL